MGDELTNLPHHLRQEALRQLVVGNVDHQRRDTLENLRQRDVIRLRDQGCAREGRGEEEVEGSKEWEGLREDMRMEGWGKVGGKRISMREERERGEVTDRLCGRREMMARAKCGGRRKERSENKRYGG